MRRPNRAERRAALQEEARSKEAREKIEREAEIERLRQASLANINKRGPRVTKERLDELLAQRIAAQKDTPEVTQNRTFQTIGYLTYQTKTSPRRRAYLLQLLQQGAEKYPTSVAAQVLTHALSTIRCFERYGLIEPVVAPQRDPITRRQNSSDPSADA